MSNMPDTNAPHTVIVVMPAWNAARTLADTIGALPPRFRQSIIVGDNDSDDDTAKIARDLGVDVIRHERNLGYGGNLKKLFREAVARGATIVVELHSDGQYDPRVVDLLVAYVERGYFDVMQGNRIRSRSEALRGGMHWYRYIGNRALTLFENVWFGLTLGEWHSGMKALRAEVLSALPLETYSDTHALSSELMMDCVSHGFRVGEVPVPVRYDDSSSSVSFLKLFPYSARTVLAAFARPPWKRVRYGSAALPAAPRRTPSER